MVDVCGGKMTLREVVMEIIHYMMKSPKRLVIDIRRKESGYHTTIYLGKRDFKNKC